MTDVLIADAAMVRHRIAMAILESSCVSETIGSVKLHEHQRAVAARAVQQLRRNGGVVVAEPVGRGKTFIALAVAARIARPVTIVSPAALRDMWTDALAACGVSGTILTHEALSRGAVHHTLEALIVVDEAHRFRNPDTRRYAALAGLSRQAQLLLLTATPIQNRRDDLTSLIALFLGSQAWTMDSDALSSHVVRASSEPTAASPTLPRQRGPIVIQLDADDDCLDRIVSLPPPVPALGESIAETLLIYGLVHQWTSSRAALVESLRRRRTRGLAMLAALDAGRTPTRSELGAWTHASDAMQLAFPELVASTPAPNAGTRDLAIAIDRHLAGVDALIRHCRRMPDPDAARANALLRIRDEHPGERIIAFAHYTETVNGLRRYLAHAGQIATLSSRGVVISGGRMTRAEALAQFTPGDGRRHDAATRIDLLVATDLLSEGMNLQEASVAVHLDLPWNPARLEQRVGRIRRLGSRHQTITVYSIAPPASAESLLRIETRLRDKLRIAQHTVGIAGSILPSPLPSLASRGLAEVRGELHERLTAWRLWNDVAFDEGRTLVAAVRSTRPGCIAAIADGREDAQIVVVCDDRVSDRTEEVLSLIANAAIDDVDVDDDLLRQMFVQLARFADQRRGASAIDLNAVAATRSRRAALDRVARTLARAPRHRRAQIVGLADAARLAATASLGAGAERILDVLVRADLPDEAWLRSLATFGELHRRGAPPSQAVHPRPVAVLLLQPKAL